RGTRARREPAVRGIRWHHGGDAKHAPVRRGDRVHAVEGRALDESPPHASRVSPRPDVCAPTRTADAGPHIPGSHLAIAGRPGTSTRGVQAVPDAAKARA